MPRPLHELLASGSSTCVGPLVDVTPVHSLVVLDLLFLAFVIAEAVQLPMSASGSSACVGPLVDGTPVHALIVA